MNDQGTGTTHTNQGHIKETHRKPSVESEASHAPKGESALRPNHIEKILSDFKPKKRHMNYFNATIQVQHKALTEKKKTHKFNKDFKCM